MIQLLRTLKLIYNGAAGFVAEGALRQRRLALGRPAVRPSSQGT